MTVRTPTVEQLRGLARQCGLSLEQADLASMQELMAPLVDAYKVVEALPDEHPQVAHPRARGHRPSPEENPYNAWYWKASVRGAEEGPLAGRTVVLKDNVMLAGVPMMIGAATLEGYVPDFDATIVTRILDAGGEIVGKSNCEYLCISGGSHTSALGPVRNPHSTDRSAGGSSSGSAVLVATGEVDLAIGGDQGGSVRMPAAFCGVCGMKPTWGLVPYTGIMPIEIFVDHTGPLSQTVAENARLLEVIAGDDGYDPRVRAPRVHRYSEVLERGVEGLRIAVLKEGFEQPLAEERVNEKVRMAADRLAAAGAVMEEVSVPLHRTAADVWIPIVVEGLTQTLMLGDGFGVSRNDLFPLSLMDRHRGWRSRADELSEPLKLCLLFGLYAREHYGSRYYGKAVNLARRIRGAYDAVLEDHDLLLLPTTPMTATALPAVDAPREEIVERAFEIASNTSPFNISHHPSMSVPCGLADGLPVGLMLVGRHFDEPSVYRAAAALERSGEWRYL